MRGLAADREDSFTSCDEVYVSFDTMGLLENLLRGIYAFGIGNYNLVFLSVELSYFHDK